MRLSITILNLLSLFLLLLLLIFASSSSFQVQPRTRTRTTPTMATVLGGVHDDSHSLDQNTAEIDQLARFAVEDHNNKQNSLIEFVKVVKAREQVVAGTLHHLTIEAIDGGIKKIYEAKIWVKPWINFKEVQEFNHVPDHHHHDSAAAAASTAATATATATSSFTSSDLGLKTGGHGEGLQVVASHDPMVQDAAEHAVKSIQQRSNSLFPYELSEILHAKAQVLEESAVVFDILLKLKRGDKEEKIKVKVHKNNEGAYVLNHMETAT